MPEHLRYLHALKSRVFGAVKCFRASSP